MAGGFDLLSPALQYQIANTLGFAELRPIQDRAIAEILAGHNCVVLAPTAGGKTEAALFPLLSQMDREDWRPVSVIYVAPIRALLNNQEARVQRYTGLIGRRAFKWHGDVSPGQKRRFCADPADVLLTTPESLEVMLMSRKVPAARLFRHLRAVVVDEVHAFVADDRGGHLSAVLERLSRFCGRDVQRIGLSATVGNPADILAWAAGSSQRAGAVVDPGGAGAAPDLSLDYVGTLDNAATVIAALHPGAKRLVFVDSRRRVEALGKLLRERDVSTFVTHSSLARDERDAAERAFEQGKDCVIVATSAMELGIDIGDLDHVLQVDAPGTVAGFLQRMGRTGRRPGTRANCTFLTTSEDQLIQCAALLRLHRAGFVESLPLQTRAAHLLAHQILALSIQEGGVPASDWWAWVARATPFRDLDPDDRAELLGHMLARDIVHDVGGRLVLGDRGEKLYGFRNFSELYAVFEAPATLTVLWGNQEIGTIDARFAEQQELARLTFTLGAKTWKALDVDWWRGVIRVQPVADGALARWHGRPTLLGAELCRAMRDVLVSSDIDEPWSKRARQRIAAVRGEYDFLSPAGLDLLGDSAGFRLWTFAGGRANNLLARVLEGELGSRIVSHNGYIAFRDDAAKSRVAIAQALDRLRDHGRPDDHDARRFAELCTRRRISKFEPCLPERLQAELLAAALTDPATARRALVP